MTDTLMPDTLMPNAPTPDALRPMHLGEILDRTVQIYRRQFLLFAGIAAGPSVVVLGCFAAGALLLYTARNGGTTANALAGLGVLGVMLVGLPLYIVASAFGYAAVSQGGEETILRRGSNHPQHVSRSMAARLALPRIVWAGLSDPWRGAGGCPVCSIDRPWCCCDRDGRRINHQSPA